LLLGCGYALLWSQTGGQDATGSSAELAALQSMQSRMQSAGIAAAGAAAAKLRSPSSSGSPVLPTQFYKTAMSLAIKTGMRDGCRGDRVCMRAVGLFFGTQTGKTEDVAGMIASETGLEAKDIGDVSADDLAGYDGLIVGAPTWHTGADEQRTGTTWDDYFEQIRALSLGGKPVAVFGVGDSVGYGDNFCDAIEELHSTFEAAGAKMLGYVSSEGYQHTDTKSVRGGKFLGLATDQDNEDDMSGDRVKSWVAQIKGEGMPIV
jgi:flavodoxin I